MKPHLNMRLVYASVFSIVTSIGAIWVTSPTFATGKVDSVADSQRTEISQSNDEYLSDSPQTVVAPAPSAPASSNKQAIIRARANLEAVSRFTVSAKNELAVYQSLIDKLLETVAASANAQPQTFIGVNQDQAVAEADSAQGILSLRQKKIRILAEQALDHFINRLAKNYESNMNLAQLLFKYSVGDKFPYSRYNFIQAAVSLDNDLKSPNTIPDASAFNFFNATKKLLMSSSGAAPTMDDSGVLSVKPDFLAITERDDLVDALNAQRSDFFTALADYNDAKIAFLNAKLSRDTTIAAAKVDHEEKQLEIQRKIYELDNNLRAAQADLDSAQNLYSEQ